MSLSRRTLKKFRNNIFVETGTYNGMGIRRAISVGFKEIHSIEMDAARFAAASKRFAALPQVHLYHGDSAAILPSVVASLSGPATFWLDAHPPTMLDESNCPVFQELDIIRRLAKWVPKVMVDDLRMFSKDDVKRLEEAISAIFKERNIVFSISYENGSSFQSDVLAGVEEKEMVS